MESPTLVMNKIQNTFLLQHLLKLGFLDKLLNSDKTAFIKIDQDNLHKVVSPTLAEKQAMASTVK